MASSVAVRKERKRKMRLRPDNSDDQMVVKSLSVPPGLEALMEGLTREVLRTQPQDICLFASEHFARLIKMREAGFCTNEYQFCKTTIHDKIKQKNVPSRVATQQSQQQPGPKDDVETIDGTSSTPRLDFGRLTNGVSPEIKRNRSEASTAEIDKIQDGFFESKPAEVDVIHSQIKECNEHVNTHDEVVNKEEENGTRTQVQINDDKAEADDVKNIEAPEHDDNESGKSDEKDDNVAKEVNEELAGSIEENVQSNTVEEDDRIKENQIQDEETKVDTVKDNEACENIEKDAVTKEGSEIPNEEGKVNVEQKEETAAHDECEETETTHTANKIEPVHKDNEENLDSVEETQVEHLAARNKEAESNETEQKKEAGKKPEDAKPPEETESKLETTEEHDDLSDSNDVVTQETEQDIKTKSPADKVQISPMEENSDDGSSLEDKREPSTVVEQVQDSAEAKLVDENHEEQAEGKNTENEYNSELEKDVINDEVTEKESHKTPVPNTLVEDVKTDDVENAEHSIRKRSVSQAEEPEVHNLTIPEISTTVATPTPSEDGSTSADDVTKELDEAVNLTSGDDTEEEKQIKAATKLQSCWRGYSLRKMRKSATVDNEEQQEDLQKLTTAATVIQALWRGYTFRKAKATETTAAEAENITSDETSTGKDAAADVPAEQTIAATKIQSSWRGHNVRKKRHIDMNGTAKASDDVHDKEGVEEKPSGNESQSKEIAKEMMAATVIQALWRGYAIRKSRHLESANESAQQNSGVDIGKLHLAAAKIQSLWRGHNVRKVQNSSTVVAAAHEMKDTQEVTADSELDAENKTDTSIVDSDKAESEKVTEATEPAIKAEKATAMESENSVQPSDSEVNAKQDTTVPELGTEKINDTVEPEIEAAKASEVESGNIAHTTTDSDGNIEGVTASGKSDLEDAKTAEAGEHAEAVESVSKTDVPELQKETAQSDKPSDENTETTVDNDEPKSEVQSEEVAEKAEPVVKPEEIVKTDEAEGKSEEVVENAEPVIKGDEVKSEVAENTEPIVKTDEAEGELKSEEISETAEPLLKADESESTVKSEEVNEKAELLAKADEADGEVKSEEASQTAEPVIKADEVKSEVAEHAVKEEENVETAEPEVKSDEFTETAESVVKPEEIIEKPETEDKVKSENLTELAEPAESKDISETTENDEKPGEISDPEVKNEEISDEVEPSVVDETTETGESSVLDKQAPETIHSSTTAEDFTDSVKSDTVVIKPEDIANVAEPETKTEEEINETTEPEAKVEGTETEKAVVSEKDGEKNEDLHEDGSVPVLENITQELAENVDSSPIETKNELHSDKEMDSAGSGVKETEETHAVDNNVNELDEAKTISDSEKVSETNDIDKAKIEPPIIPESANNTPDTENVEVKNADITEAGDNVEISAESPENTTITTPSEDTQSEVEHASEIMKNSDNASTTSPEIAASEDAAENKEPESTVDTDEPLKEPSSTISEDSTKENLNKLDGNVDVKPSDVMVENNSEQDEHTKRLDGTDNEESNKDVNLNTNASDKTEPQDTRNTESDENAQVDNKENVTESLSPQSLDETQGDVDKHDEIKEPEITKESVEVDEARPTNQGENSNETGTTNNVVLDKSNDSSTDIKVEPANENKSEIISEPEQKSADDGQSLVKTEITTDHVDSPTAEVQCPPEISNDGASEIEAKDNGKQDVPGEKAGPEDSVKENEAATTIQSTWRGYRVRKSNSIIADGKDPEIKSDNDNATEEKSSEDTGSKTETNQDEITQPTVDTAEKTVAELGPAEENVNESANTDETVDKVENVPDEAAKEDGAMEISEPLVEKIEHSTVSSENIDKAETNDASEINNKETIGDSSSADEHNLEDTVANNEAVAETKTTEDETAEHVSDTIEDKEDTSTGPAASTAHQETTEKSEETSPNSTDNKTENVESSDRLEDDLEKHVETANDAKIKEETMNDTCSELTDMADSRAEDHKDTYQASEASTVDIRDVEDSLKSPAAADGTDLEINVHEDAEQLNESSDTRNSLDADGKVKFYVGPDETNRIQIVDDGTNQAENHGTENTDSGKLPADEVANENNSEIHKSVTSVLLSALSDDSEEVEKGGATSNANVPETDRCIDEKETTPADEGHQNDDTNNTITVNSSAPNAEENSNKNTEDATENSTENAEDAKAENINENQDNQAQDSIHKTTGNIENDGVKSAGNVANNEKLEANQDDDNEELAVNIQSFDKALSESENREKESNDVQADTDNVADESATHKDDTEDTSASEADTQNASAIPLVDGNTDKTADTVVESNTATETENVAPPDEEQHPVNSENKSDTLQNEDSTVFPRNLHDDKSSESAANDSNDIETKLDSAEGTVPPVEHENIEATTHTLHGTTAGDISHKSDSMSPSGITEEGTHAADNVNNEHESEEKREASHTPVTTTTTAEDMEIPHESQIESSSTVNEEDKHSAVDEVDKDHKNVEDGIVQTPVDAIVADMPHESDGKSSASVNDADENKNIELDETPTPVVTATEDNQNEGNEVMEHLEAKDTDTNIGEKESEKPDETTIVPSAEDVKDEGNNEKSEHSEGNIHDIQKNSEENEHVTAASNNSDVETKQPASEDLRVDDKENGQIDSAEDKDAKESIKEDSTVEKNENDIIANEERHSAVNDLKEENKNEDKPADEVKIKDIESQIEHDITGDETKQNGGATEKEGYNMTHLEKEVEPEGTNEKPAAVTGDDNKTEEDKAAVKIQSAWKGYHVRRKQSEDKELALLQRPAECDELPSSKSDVVDDADSLSQAATTIQAGARGYLVRKRRHLARVTDVPPGNADSATVDESESASEVTVIEKQADTSQSFGSRESAKSEEENTDATPKETQSNQEESVSASITPEETKDVESNIFDAEKSETNRESTTESSNDNTETEIKESSAEINESAKEQTNKEEETTNKDDKHGLDEIDALNLRLHNLSRTNVYQTDEEQESDDKADKDDHKMDSPKAVKMNFDRALSDLHAQTSKSSDDDDSVMTAPSHTDDSRNDDASKAEDDKEHETKDKPSLEEPDAAENKEVAQMLAEPKAVNLDDFDSSKYDLKVEHATARLKNTSPVHELTSAAYKIGAAIAVDDEATVDAMDETAKGEPAEKPVQYIHIPLQGPLPERMEEKPITKETLKASQEHGINDKRKDDGESPEYIYIPLKAPGTVDEEDEEPALKENIADAHIDVDNHKEETKNEEDTTSRSPRENKDDNEDNLKEKLSVSEHTEHLKTEQTGEKEDNAEKSNDPRAVLEDKEKAENNVKLEEHDLAGKEQVNAEEIHESLADHRIEKECDNETEHITKIPEPIPLMNNSSEQVLSNERLSAESKSSEPELPNGKSTGPVQQFEELGEKSPELELTETKLTDSVVCEEPIEKLTAKENLEKPPVSETKPSEQECKSTDSTVSGQCTDNLTTEKDTEKSLLENTSAEPELLENKSSEPVQQAKETRDDTNETSRTPSPVKSTSPIDDIDAVLERNKSRTISRQQNVDSSSHRTLFSEIDSLIDAYGQKRRQMSPTSNGHPDLATAKIDSESRAQGQQLSVQDKLPDVIMAHSNEADLAATKIQSAFRGYHTRQHLKEKAQPRNEDSEESDKTYTIIDKHSQGNASTPDEEVSSDDDGTKNKAAMKIQTTFREYRKKRSTEQNKSNEAAKNVPGEEQRSGVKEKHDTEQDTKEDVNTVESPEHSKEMSGEDKDPCPGKTSEHVDENKELEESIENPENQPQCQHVTSVVDQTVQQKSETSPVEKSANTLEITAQNTDEKEHVTSDSAPGSLKLHQAHAGYDSLNSEQAMRHSPERGQVQQLKITKLEDTFLDHAVTNDSGTDARPEEELKDISEMITHDDAAIKIQSTYRGFKTRQTLENRNNQLDRSLDTIPEVLSPRGLDVTKEHDTVGKHEDTGGNTMNDEEEHMTDHAYITGRAVQPHVESSESPESYRQNSAEQKYKSSNVDQLGNGTVAESKQNIRSNTAHGVARTSDEWRYRVHGDVTTDSTAKDETTSSSSGAGIQSDPTIYDEDDDSEPPYGRSPSPDGKLVQGYRNQQGAQNARRRQEPPAGLQHSGEMHDTLDIFLSSEELSQGAEMLTSRETSQKDGCDDGTGCNVIAAHAQSGSAAKHEGSELHDRHSVMETATNNQRGSNNTTSATEQQHQLRQQQQQQEQTVADDMGNGNTEAVAATKIQAGFRGYQVRKQMKLKKNGSDDAKVVKRCSSGRRRGSLRRGETPKNGTDLEERSATKIQAGIRGFLVRKRQKSTKQ